MSRVYVRLRPFDRAAAEATGIVDRHRRSAGARDEHAGKRHAARAHRPSHAQPIGEGERPRIDRVAAELRARKRRTVDEPHARAGARQHERGRAPGRSGADNQHIRHQVQSAKLKVESKWKVERAVGGNPARRECSACPDAVPHQRLARVSRSRSPTTIFEVSLRADTSPTPSARHRTARLRARFCLNALRFAMSHNATISTW
jgi:hypothetical protein